MQQSADAIEVSWYIGYKIEATLIARRIEHIAELQIGEFQNGKINNGPNLLSICYEYGIKGLVLFRNANDSVERNKLSRIMKQI